MRRNEIRIRYVLINGAVALYCNLFCFFVIFIFVVVVVAVDIIVYIVYHHHIESFSSLVSNDNKERQKMTRFLDIFE